MEEGTVKWFDTEKGYGFITSPGGEDVFIHYTAVPGEGFRVLNQGDKVRFDKVMGQKGPQARNVMSYSPRRQFKRL